MEGPFNVCLGLQVLSNSFYPLYSSGIRVWHWDFGSEDLGKCRRLYQLLSHSLHNSWESR